MKTLTGLRAVALQMIEYAERRVPILSGHAARNSAAMIAERHGVTPDMMRHHNRVMAGRFVPCADLRSEGPLSWHRLPVLDTTARSMPSIWRWRKIDRVPLAADMKHRPCPAMEARSPARTVCQLPANPNNPDRHGIDPENLEGSGEAHVQPVTVLVDGGVIWNSNDPDGNTCSRPGKEGHNGHRFRARSPRYTAMAGIRVGYTISSPETAAENTEYVHVHGFSGWAWRARHRQL